MHFALSDFAAVMGCRAGLFLKASCALADFFVARFGFFWFSLFWVFSLCWRFMFSIFFCEEVEVMFGDHRERISVKKQPLAMGLAPKLTAHAPLTAQAPGEFWSVPRCS